MNENTISPDDPRLTAYALNEMAAAERAEFEKLLQQDTAARQAVEEIRAAGTLLATALEAEPLAAIPTTKKEAAIVAGGGPLKERLNRPIRFPQFYYIVSGLAAACFALFFIHWQRNQPPPKSYVEVDLTKFSAAEAKAKGPATAASGGGTGTLARQSAALQPAVTLGLPPVEAQPKEEAALVLGQFDTAAAPSPDGYAAATTLAGGRMPTEGRNMSNVTIQADSMARSDAYYANARTERERQSYPAPAPVAAMKMALVAPMAESEFSTETYGYRKDNDYQRVKDQPLSTFSVDVDTAAYANVRRFLNQGQRPPADAVRIEELVNYFSYHYTPPAGPAPFAAHLEVASAPWAPEHRLVRIGLKGREVSDAARPAANLVFLVDVSGSMQSPHKLPLVRQSLRLLVDKLRPDDRVALAVYAGSSGLALPSTPVSRKADILEAIDRLEAGGSTNGALGIHLAYDIAKANFIAGGVNRVILATDGDFNVGTTSEGELVRLVGEKAKSGVFLSVLGYGMGNLKDGTLEQLADKGNGNYAYIDSLAEARKALVEQAGGTLVTIAKDVKIQVEFNPAQVAAYRLIGYENRLLAKEDFNNDAVDAGEIGAGHTVTALYEVVPAGAELPVETPAVDELKYQQVETPNAKRQISNSGELLTVKIRYKEPAGDVSSKLEFALSDTGARFEEASQDFKFAAAVAAFGMALRDSPHKGSLTLADVSAWGRAGLGSDAGGQRGEFLGLVEKAQALMP
ncbi:MAG: YfbK domain-containing protein [Verrucomicrobiota bacterium]